MSDFTQKEKIAIVVEDGLVVGVYSSLSPNVVDVEIFDMDTGDNVLDRDALRVSLDKAIENGELPFTLF